MINNIKRYFYVLAMMKSIDKARTNHSYENKIRRKSVGLMVIRDFEEVNGIKFNPFEIKHRDMVSGMGVFKDCIFALKISPKTKTTKNPL